MGICLFQGTDTSVEDVMKRAELALRQAKQAGRQGVRYFDPLVEAQVKQRSQRTDGTGKTKRAGYRTAHVERLCMEHDCQRGPKGTEANG